MKHSPDNAKARINLGVILAESGSYEEAMQRYNETAALMKSDDGVHVGKGILYVQKQMHEKAKESFEKL